MYFGYNAQGQPNRFAPYPAGGQQAPPPPGAGGPQPPGAGGPPPPGAGAPPPPGAGGPAAPAMDPYTKHYYDIKMRGMLANDLREEYTFAPKTHFAASYHRSNPAIKGPRALPVYKSTGVLAKPTPNKPPRPKVITMGMTKYTEQEWERTEQVYADDPSFHALAGSRLRPPEAPPRPTDIKDALLHDENWVKKDDYGLTRTQRVWQSSRQANPHHNSIYYHTAASTFVFPTRGKKWKNKRGEVQHLRVPIRDLCSENWNALQAYHGHVVNSFVAPQVQAMWELEAHLEVAGKAMDLSTPAQLQLAMTVATKLSFFNSFQRTYFEILRRRGHLKTWKNDTTLTPQQIRSFDDEQALLLDNWGRTFTLGHTQMELLANALDPSAPPAAHLDQLIASRSNFPFNGAWNKRMDPLKPFAEISESAWRLAPWTDTYRQETAKNLNTLKDTLGNINDTDYVNLASWAAKQNDGKLPEFVKTKLKRLRNPALQKDIQRLVKN